MLGIYRRRMIPRWSGVRWEGLAVVSTPRQSAGWCPGADPFFPGLGAAALQDQYLVLVVPLPRRDPSCPAAGGVVQGDHPRGGAASCEATSAVLASPT